MRNQKTIVKINSEVLKWIRESAGWEIRELAEKIEIEPEIFHSWETRDTTIDLKKLKKLGNVLKRPLTVFFLDKPPKEGTLTDYRKVAGLETDKLSKKTFTAIRDARYVQSIAHELFILQNPDNKPRINKVSLKDNPEKVAKTEQRNLEFEEKNKERIVKKQPRQVYNELREKIESRNIFVMQASMPIEDARGFTLSGKYPRVIVINSADDIKPRIFTLLHEYAHILLKKDGICLPNSENFKTRSKSEMQKIEKWCNTFAGSLLMPKQRFINELSRNEGLSEDLETIINNLSEKFSVSKKAVLVRILNLLKKPSQKQMYINHYEKIIFTPTSRPKKKNGGGPHPADKCISQRGKKFVKLVSDSCEKRLINSSDMTSYLNLRIKHFDRLEARI